MTWFPRLLMLALLALLLPAAAHAAEFTPAQRAEIVGIVRDALKQDPAILRDAIGALQADEAKRQAADQRATIAAHRDALVTPADPVAGNPQGDVTIVEFFDTRCPYCRRLEPVMEKFLNEDRGVKLVFKDLPILGDASVLGAKALLAAQNQGAYEKLREAIMQLPANTTLPMIEDAAKKLGLDWSRLQRDMNDPAIQQRIDANTKLARTLDIQGTPALIVGQELVPGAVDVAELRKMVETARKGG
jgi:protein-disulfide isomerase